MADTTTRFAANQQFTSSRPTKSNNILTISNDNLVMRSIYRFPIQQRIPRSRLGSRRYSWHSRDSRLLRRTGSHLILPITSLGICIVQLAFATVIWSIHAPPSHAVYVSGTIFCGFVVTVGVVSTLHEFFGRFFFDWF